MADLERELKSKLKTNMDILLSDIRSIIRKRGPAIKNTDGKPFAPYTNEEVYGILQTILDLLQKFSTDDEIAIVAALVNRESTNKKSRNSDELSSSTVEKRDRVVFTKYLNSLRQLMTQIVYFYNVRIFTMRKIDRLNQNSAEKVDPKLKQEEEKLIRLHKLLKKLEPSTLAIEDKKDIDDGSLRYFTFEFVRDIYYDIFDEYVSVALTSDIEEIENQLREHGKKGNENSEPDFDKVEENKKICKLADLLCKL